MKAISLWQPWATLVAIEAKKIETRSWYTDYRGPLAIASTKTYPEEAAQLCLTEPFLSALKSAGLMQFGVWHKSNNELPLGAVVATCELVHCYKISPAIAFPACKSFAWQGREWKLDERERAFGNYAEGRYMWLLANIKRLPEPVPAKGKQGFWEWQP